MSEATERLLELWTRLAEDAAASVLGLCRSLHEPRVESPRSAALVHPVVPHVRPDSFTISVGGACQPAYAGPGAVHVGVPPQSVLVPLEKMLVQRIEPGQTKMILRPNPARGPQELRPGLDQVDVAIDPILESVGLYYGRVREATGAVDSPFLIYIDGLP